MRRRGEMCLESMGARTARRIGMWDWVYVPRVTPSQYANGTPQDQGYFWALKQYVPHRILDLDLSYEITTCIWNQYDVGLHGHANVTVADQVASQRHLEMTPNEGKLILPSILHL